MSEMKFYDISKIENMKDELIEMIKRNNWMRWAVEAELYFKNKKKP